MAPEIRPVKPEDCDSIVQLFQELDEHHRENLPSFFQSPDQPFRTRKFLTSRLDDVNATLFLAELKEIVGFVSVKLFESPSIPIFVPQTRASISDIYVHSDFRREGLAKSMMLRAEGWAKEHGAVGMDLTVYEFNGGARQLFKEMGYSVLSSRMSKDII